MGDRAHVAAGVRLAARAAMQVLLVSANSVTLAAFHETGEASRLAASGVLGFLISAVWWSNARAVSLDAIPAGRLWYAAGASCGTVAGAALAYVVLR